MGRLDGRPFSSCCVSARVSGRPLFILTYSFIHSYFQFPVYFPFHLILWTYRRSGWHMIKEDVHILSVPAICRGQFAMSDSRIQHCSFLEIDQSDCTCACAMTSMSTTRGPGLPMVRTRKRSSLGVYMGTWSLHVTVAALRCLTCLVLIRAGFQLRAGRSPKETLKYVFLGATYSAVAT
jgi:hypothetical protein